MRLALGLILALAPLLASCSGAKAAPERRLILSMEPPELKAGQLIQISVRPEPEAALAWVSGTVKVMGAPVMPFRKDEHGLWKFKTMIPVFASISPGHYEAKAWGDSTAGQHYEGNLIIEVK